MISHAQPQNSGFETRPERSVACQNKSKGLGKGPSEERQSVNQILSPFPVCRRPGAKITTSSAESPREARMEANDRADRGRALMPFGTETSLLGEAIRSRRPQSR